jgi:hypothetical protein
MWASVALPPRQSITAQNHQGYKPPDCCLLIGDAKDRGHVANRRGFRLHLPALSGQGSSPALPFHRRQCRIGPTAPSRLGNGRVDLRDTCVDVSNSMGRNLDPRGNFRVLRLATHGQSLATPSPAIRP